MALIFKDKRESGYQIVSGVDTVTVTVDFAPNFIEATFTDIQTKDLADSVTLASVTKTGATTYEVDFDYSVSVKRTIKWVVAKLPVSPEQTINF